MVTIDITGLPEDKVKYLQQLIESWRQAETNSREDADQAWEEFFLTGDRLAEGDEPDKETLTSAVLSMRR